MDINKIFETFKPEDEINETTQVVFEGPIMWIGMFKKLIANYEIFTKQIIIFFRMSNQDLDIDDIERASSYMVYTRAYDNLTKIDPDNLIHLEALKLYSDKSFKIALKNALEYYERIEEYEKCAFLKKIQDVVVLS
jgi:hypothetical protein